jgi:hypothetical protein
MIERSAYTRRAHRRHAFKRSNGATIHATTVKRSRVQSGKVKDRGAPGKWSDKHGPGIGQLKQGALSRFGYSSTAKPESRHKSLRKAVRKYGSLSTFRKLQAISIYTKRTSKGKSKTYKADRNWVKKTFMKE